MRKITLALLLLVCFISADAQTITRLIGASPFQDSLWVFDTTNFNVIRRLAPTPSVGGSITGTNGMAKDPSTGIIYVVVKQSAVSGRVLGTLDPLTGVVTIVGNLGDNFAGITFNGNNTLIGVTGDGANVPETAYRIDKTNANKTVLRTLGNGGDGEAICYNPADNMYYHWSGNFPNTPAIFEKFDTSGVTVTNVPMSGTQQGEIFGAVYRSNNEFLLSNINSRFMTWNANGTIGAQIGSGSPDDLRGLAYLTCSRAITGTPSYCAGDSTLLTHGSAGAAGYQWYLNGVIISGATSQTYYASAPGHYNCIVSDACGTDSASAGVDVTQNALPSVNVSAASTVICSGDSTQLTGSSGGTSQWYLNGSPIAGATNNVYFATAPGWYNMIKTNMNGCSDSAAVGVAITVNPTPIVNVGNDTSVCGSITLDAGNPGATYMWCDGSTTQTIMFAASGTCAVAVTDSNGCSASDTITVTVNPDPVVNVGNDTTVCGSILLDAGNPGSSYLWCDGTTTQTAVITSSTTCTVMVTDTNGCSGTDTIAVTVNQFPVISLSTANDSLCPANPPVTINVSPAGGTLAGPGITGTQFDAFAAGSGMHTITYVYTDSITGCSADDSLMMFVFPIVNISATASDNSVCTTDAVVTLSGNPNGGFFSGPGVSGATFDPAVAGVGTHLVQYIFTDTNSCNFATVVSITVSACVGIEETTGSSFALFPNPSEGTVNVVLGAGTSIVTVINPVGETVLTATLQAGTHTLDLSGYASGIYMVRVQGEQGVSAQQLFISK